VAWASAPPRNRLVEVATRQARKTFFMAGS
jgi:hypothetical protein